MTFQRLRLLSCVLAVITAWPGPAPAAIRLGVAGMVHGHLNGFLHRKNYQRDFQIVGFSDANQQLHKKYGERFAFDDSLFFTDLQTMLETAKPEAVVVFSTTFDHKRIVDVCAARGVHVMMEKPMAVSLEHARAMQAAAQRSGIHVLVNYETTWHARNHFIYQTVKQEQAVGHLRKVIVRDGHRGPQEIGCPQEFLDWLTDPKLNGGGALYDFGCYGANLITWLMDNQRPTSVTAVTQQHKPEIYPKVDDEATVILTYPGMQGIIQASWNWRFGRKDMDVYGTKGYLTDTYGSLRLHTDDRGRQQVKAPALKSPYRNSMDYFAAVLREQIQPEGLSALENAVIVSEILDAARRSAQTGKTITLDDVGHSSLERTEIQSSSSGETCPDKRPNVLIVLTDDMGFSDLGCYGGEIETPHLDSLAANGLRFTNFRNTARCWPTRATLMSGIYSSKLSNRQVTIAEVLKEAGYQTGMVGKWHLGRDPLKDGPIQRGFDRYYGTLGGAGSFWRPPLLTRDTQFVEPEGDDYYYTDKIGEEAVRQIEAFAGDGRPFFQYVAFTAAHWPLHAPEATIQKYIPRYRGGWEKLRNDRYHRMLELGIIEKEHWPLPAMEPGVVDWQNVEHKDWWIRNMAVYAAMVDHMDRAVGRIVDALQRTGQLDNTLIVYMHDNGACAEHLSGKGWGSATNVVEWAQQHGKTVAIGNQYDVPMGGPYTYGSVGRHWACAQNTPLRRYKANVHEGGACTPCIMHWPQGMTYRGDITRQRGHVVDLMATCLELAGAEYPACYKGTDILPHESLSLVPVITGGQQPRDHAYYFNHNRTQAVVRGDWKLVRERKSPWHLYHLIGDRTETRDLADDNPERVRHLSALYEQWAEHQTTVPGPMR